MKEYIPSVLFLVTQKDTKRRPLLIPKEDQKETVSDQNETNQYQERIYVVERPWHKTQIISPKEETKFAQQN